MNDNDLGILVRRELMDGMGRYGFPVEVIQTNQPTTQGRPDRAFLYFFQVSDTRYGWQGKNRVYNPLLGRIVTTEMQYMETTFQVGALAPRDPKNLSLPTAKDLVNYAAMVVNGSGFIDAMTRAKAGVQRVMQIINPVFLNDRGAFEESPSFDFIVSHKRTATEQSPAAESIEVAIHRV